MPKIDAANVRQHRQQRRDQLIAAAEELLAQDGVGALTAGNVAARAGIARNSLYRYFDSVEDLVELVVTAEFPTWCAAVRDAVDAEPDPQLRPAAYTRATIEQAGRRTHGWRSSLSRHTLSPQARERVKDLHTELSRILGDAVTALDVPRPDLVTEVVQSLVDACVRRIDAGDDVTDVLTYATEATNRLVGP